MFTLPEPIQPLILQNRRVLYDLLFQAASQTLRDLSADPKRLGGQVGFTAVLHTWGQKLLFHPHLHCVVTGGALSPDGTRWIAARPDYFLPVKVLSRLFRGKFLAGLKNAFESGALTLTGRLQHLTHPRVFEGWRSGLYRQKFVVYAKPPFGGPEIVYRYLGRYTHRVAISNSRLLAMEANVVRFQYKDYADGDRSKELILDADEFLRRFLLHVLPKGFVRIRHYGLLAGPNVATKLARCRQLLSPMTAPQRPPAVPKTWAERVLEWTGQDVTCCPCCAGPLRRQAFERGIRPSVPPTRRPSESSAGLAGDTS